MGRILAAMLLLASPALANNYPKPANAPTVFVPSHGVEVGVWAAQTAVGHGIGIFERSTSGAWVLCAQCLVSPEYPTLDSAVAAAGGAGPYVAGKLADINAVLSIRYPVVAPEPTGTTLDRVNGALAGYAVRLVNGVPQVGPR